MATFTKRVLSGSTEGAAVFVAGTGTAAFTVIHTAPTSQSQMDEIWLWATNPTTAATKLTLHWGDSTNNTAVVEVIVDPEAGPKQLIPGWVLLGTTNTARQVLAYTSTATASLFITGYVNRITS